MEAVCHCQRIAFRSDSEPMPVQTALTHRTRVDHTIFEKGLRVRTHAPCELSHVSLTALARSAQRTGFYVRSIDALALGGALTILTGMLCTATISRCAPTASVRYTQNLKLVSLSFSPRQHAHCTPRTLASTHVCFERATTEVVFVHSTP